MRALLSHGRRIVALAVVMLVVAGGIAFAAIPSGDGVFTACKLNAYRDDPADRSVAPELVAA